jgi:hypothetical protein
MEGRVNKLINIDNRHRRARSESNRIEGLALQILEHISSNPQPASRAGRGHPQPAHRAGRGRASSRNTSSRTLASGPRSVSFSSVCACPGLGCTSGPGTTHPPAYSELNPAAPSFTPAHPQSRNKARRSRIPGGSSSTLCRPRLSYPDPRNLTVLPATLPRETVILDTGLATPVLLLPPDHFAASRKASDSVGSTTSPPTRACSPQPAAPTPIRASTPRPTASAQAPPLPPRCHSPIIEPDTSHIGQEEATRTKKQIELGFRVNIAEQFSHKPGNIDKSYDYSCSCLNRKSLCTCSEAVLEVCLRVRYHLFKTV